MIFCDLAFEVIGKFINYTMNLLKITSLEEKCIHLKLRALI